MEVVGLSLVFFQIAVERDRTVFFSIGSRIDGVENSMTFTLVSIFCNEAYSTFSLSTYGRSTSVVYCIQ